MKLVLATLNSGKIAEFRQILMDKSFVNVRSLLDYPTIPGIIESRRTFAGNAIKKAVEVSKHINAVTIADDSGLEIDALDGEPGVLSARYAGENSTPDQLITKVLKRLEKTPDVERTARFRCAIALVIPSCEETVIEVVEGVCEGKVTLNKRGEHGFGYDPIFVPLGYNQTFAELGSEIKNKISHRAKALGMIMKLILS
ncbi:MAG: RdgB/HAM1 family non-canonical purine NTP pyrophosphatase [Candidatus Poribacteria bacterium]|jgi:XTP/dITP diphosphohydrolase|nr:RdgB/HAM1 family non-canonical purine NTP pyrophosphatase [Candidatus Poribacteria bacterium]